MTASRSAGGRTPRRFLRFLDDVQSETCGVPSLAVIGCADGKFVLPAARRRFRVTAIDTDERMLFGCPTEREVGIATAVAGLNARLAVEHLARAVSILQADFMQVRLTAHDALWTSGALQYSSNEGYPIEEMLRKIRAFVKPTGLVGIEFMLPEGRLVGRQHCPGPEWWRK